MNLRLASCATGAVLVHAVLLFGLHLDRNAAALAVSDQPTDVEVALVSEAPPEAEPEPPPPVEPPPDQPPPPEPPPPDQTPPPPPTDEMTEPSETPPAPVQLRPPAPVHPAVTKPAHSVHSEPRPGPPHASVPGASASANAQPGVTARAQYRSNPKPDYPEEAKRQHQEGLVMLSVGVSAEGRVTDVSVSRSSGFPLLDQAAVAAVRRWTFAPATTLGVPVASRPPVPIRFRAPTQ